MAERKNPSRVSAPDRQAPRHETMIHCEICGEDYSATYKRCPFCNEPPSRGGAAGGGRRGGGYGAPVNPVQIAKVVISLVLIIAAVYIVTTKLVPIFFDGNKNPGTSQVDPNKSQQDNKPEPGKSQEDDKPDDKPGTKPDNKPGTKPDSKPGVKPDSKPMPTVNSITLDKADFTLPTNGSYTLKATVDPASAADSIVWTSSDPDVARVSASGTISNVNSGSSKKKATITATCGGKTVSCTVYCKGGSNPAPALPDAPDSKPGTVKPDPKPNTKPDTKPDSKPSSVKPNTPGTIVNADGGLNIRSGPGTNHEIVASASNGGHVTILEDAGNGWYKVDYGNDKVGYVSKDYVKVD